MSDPKKYAFYPRATINPRACHNGHSHARFPDVLLALAGTQRGSIRDGRFDPVAGKISASELRTQTFQLGPAYDVLLSPEKADLVREIIDAVWSMVDDAYHNGMDTAIYLTTTGHGSRIEEEKE